MPAPPPRPPGSSTTPGHTETNTPHDLPRVAVSGSPTTPPLPRAPIRSPRPIIKQAPAPRSSLRNELRQAGIDQIRPAPATGLTQTPAPVVTPQPISTMRTYSSDVNRTLSRERLSMADIARAEEERRRRQGRAQPKKRRGSYVGTIILLFLLLTIGGAALYLAFNALGGPDNLVTEGNTRTPLIVTESQEGIEITGRSAADIREQLRVRLLSADITIATIREYFFTVEQVINNEPAKLYVNSPLFLDALDTAMPAELARNLEDRFMYGIFSFDGNAGFLILKPTSLTIAFASMLDWEDNGLIRSMAPLLRRQSLTQSDIFAPFTDAVISNQDVRIAYNDQGEEVLIYSLTSQNNLVLASDSETFEEVIARLNTPPPVVR